jgi:outer membrane protein assembly factor BamB
VNAIRKGVPVLLAAIPLLGGSNRIPGSPQPTWTVPVGMHPMYRTHSPILDKGRLYFVAHNDFRNNVYCLNAATGASLWRSEVRVTRVDLHPDESLRVFTMDRFYVGLNPETGESFDSDDLLARTDIYESNFYPLFADGSIVMLSGGELVGLGKGGEKWRVKPGWHGGLDLTPLVAYKGLVLTGAEEGLNRPQGGLKAYRQQTGVLEWTAPGVRSPKAVKLHGDVALVYDGIWTDPNNYAPMVKAFDASTGRQLWAISTNEEEVLHFRPVQQSQAEGDLLIMPFLKDPKSSFTLRAVDLHTGAPKGEFSLDVIGFTISQGVVYAIHGKEVVGMDATSGKVLWRSAPLADTPTALFSADGLIYASDRRTLSAWAAK